MNPSLLLLALRARYKIVLLALGVTVLAAVVFSMMQPKKYEATVAMVVNYKGVDPVTGLSAPAQLMPGYIATQVDIIKSKSVALKVVDDLGLANAPDAQARFQNATGGNGGTLREWLAERGVDVVFLPPYSPDFSPIEQAWSKLKTKLRTCAARSYEALKQALLDAIDWITSQDARNWFDHCGYHTQPA